MADVQQLLVGVGLLQRAEPSLRYDDRIASAVREFQRSRDITPDGICDFATWRALEETEHHLGDRLLYLTEPMFRGDDVSELQLRLGSLGFDSGRVDGIFGHTTERALGEFQTNAGLVCDHVCGPDTTEALRNLATRGRPESIAGVREREELRPLADGGTAAVVHIDPAAAALVALIADDLLSIGVRVGVFTATDWRGAASIVNESIGATETQCLCLAVELHAEDSLEVGYFATDGFSSARGRSFGSALVAELPSVHGWGRALLSGRRSEILRATRPPAVLVSIGSPRHVEESGHLVAAAASRAVQRLAAPT